MEYVALYSRGNPEPHGAIRESMAKQVVEDLSSALGIDFYTEPISEEEADRIRDYITGKPLSSGIEMIFENHRKRQ